ncbi:MAG: NAD-dependent epimerase/dehydratase family protein [Acidobacteria bacterium]|nr:NAD-dependent epimerase/dehydratase family protein [Acidobacteriota bacterium]
MNEQYLITGGAGFIGINLADHYLTQKKHVTIFDNFSRAGTESNVDWLAKRHSDGLRVFRGDVRWPGEEFQELVEESEVLVHLAAQVAVTTSVTDPAEDFEINARGTFNVMEAVRTSFSKPIVLYSSTNKVYGKMDDLSVTERDGRYSYSNLHTGIPVSRPLEFYSPYGCSKGCGDQYVQDYARIYGLNTVVFRQSCIYGPHQFGIEDQGWVAWFAIRAMQGLPFTIYGDGKQVRDVLYIDDLIRAYDLAIEHIEKTSGRAYNIGGGPQNTLSLLEFVALLEEQFGKRLEFDFEDWRPGDQLVYVSDLRQAAEDFGWMPEVSSIEGVANLVDWLSLNRSLFHAGEFSGPEIRMAA